MHMTDMIQSWGTRVVEKITSGRWLMTVMVNIVGGVAIVKGITLPDYFIAIWSGINAFYFLRNDK